MQLSHSIFINILKATICDLMPNNQTNKFGKWKKTQHQRFMKALIKYGKNWMEIQKYVGTRTLAQVRSHSQKLFLSMSKQQRMLFQEEIKSRFSSFCEPQKSKLQQSQGILDIKTVLFDGQISKLYEDKDQNQNNKQMKKQIEKDIIEAEKQQKYENRNIYEQNPPYKSAKNIISSMKQNQKPKIQQNFNSKIGIIENTEHIPQYTIQYIPLIYWYVY